MMDNKYVTTAQVGGGGLLVWVSNLDLASWSFIVGMAGVIIGVLGGLYWQWRKDRRDAVVNAAILAAIRERGVILNDKHLD